MASRRDLFQSYQFLTQRVVAGLVLRESDPLQSPVRRMGGAAFGSVMVAVLVLAVVGVIGVINPGGNSTWQTAGAVVVEEETGTRFVYLPDDDGTMRLHQVANFASAALLTRSTEVVSVSSASLDGVLRGPRLGIDGAPDALPAADDLLTDPWTLCSAPVSAASGESVPLTALLVGGGAGGGRSLGDDVLLVRDRGTGELQLVWRGRHHLVVDEDAVLLALSLRDVPQVEVGSAWLSGLPAGQPLQPEPVAGRGVPSTAVPGALVGQVGRVGGGDGGGDSAQWYQVDLDRVVEITEVQARILLADPSTAQQAYGGGEPTPLELSAVDVTGVDSVELPEADPADPPAVLPTPAQVAGSDETLCAGFADGGDPDDVRVGARVDLAGGVLGPGATSTGTALADLVVVPPGRGALVSARASAEASSGALFLVTDEGRAYPVPSPVEAADLGYDAAAAVPLPEQLVARIAPGPALSEAAARAAA
ncbi:type VII secretion protein EccB [Klenkia soli]|uniref:Type VII secretion protein EccB n=1 Tax=Klenkia soli TaxID=1052260 RepID=A0A1H0TFJ0_9ACTN|nr:type VII secretion protein EccB [Klenkia soli]SDP52601.1 type VII secretion protein EccB [Klenkia soli]